MMANNGFLFLSANTPWVYALAETLAVCHSTYAVRFYDWANYIRLRPRWPNSTPPLLRRIMRVLPPGYAGSLELLARPYMRSHIQCWCRQLEKTNGEYPWVVAPYPYLAPWVQEIPSRYLIYYNLDDYVLYQPARKDKILAQEAEIVKRANVILCLSQFQVEALRQRYPHKGDVIYHYPLGVVEAYINPHPEASPEPVTVGYVGNLSDRVDWQLICQVAQACPEVTFVFVGGLESDSQAATSPEWLHNRTTALSLPNVRHVGKVPQEQVKRYYWSFAVNWIPYVSDHPFNRASCPTKIMDAMAAGRPVLSTDIPECRLYPEWIKIFQTTAEAAALIRQSLVVQDTAEAREKTVKQIDFITRQTWQVRAVELENLLSQGGS